MANLKSFLPYKRKAKTEILNANLYVSNQTLTEAIVDFANKAKLSDDDFVRQSLTRTANVLDHLSSGIDRIGAEAGRSAAEITRKEISAGIGRIIFRLDALKFGARLAVLCVACYICLMIGRGMDINTPLGPMPRDMAQSLALQDWTIQYATCRPQPANSGVEWCLMPYVKSISIPR